MPVGWSVCRSVCLSPKNYKKITKLSKHYKSIQNIEKHWNKEFLPLPPSFMKTVKEASALCQSFLDGVVIFLKSNLWNENCSSQLIFMVSNIIQAMIAYNRCTFWQNFLFSLSNMQCYKHMKNGGGNNAFFMLLNTLL